MKGFTLIELMLALALIAIISGIATGIYMKFSKYKFCTQTESVTHQTMLEAVKYYTEYNAPPPSNATALNIELPKGLNATINITFNATRENPVIITSTPASSCQCPRGATYTLRENESEGEWN